MAKKQQHRSARKRAKTSAAAKSFNLCSRVRLLSSAPSRPRPSANWASDSGPFCELIKFLAFQRGSSPVEVAPSVLPGPATFFEVGPKNTKSAVGDCFCVFRCHRLRPRGGVLEHSPVSSKCRFVDLSILALMNLQSLQCWLSIELHRSREGRGIWQC